MYREAYASLTVIGLPLLSAAINLEGSPRLKAER